MLAVTLLAALVALASASHLQLGVDIFHRTDAGLVPGRPDLAKRSNFQATLFNHDILLMVNVSIGSTKQPIRVVLDTGSLDLWVVAASSPACTKSSHLYSTNTECLTYGAFNASLLLTFNDLDTAFGIMYSDSSYALGSWARDSVTIGGVTVENLMFGYVDNTTVAQGVCGVGLALLELSVISKNTGSKFVYDNLPMKLYREGIIDWPVFLVWLNSYTSDLGNILFGAVDYAKYTGDLMVVPMVPSNPKYGFIDRLAISLRGVVLLGSTAQLLPYPVAVTLDLGYTVTALPPEMVHNLVKQLKLTWNKAASAYMGPCSTDMSGVLTFQLDGFNVDIPMANYWVQMGTDDSGTKMCFLTIQPSLGPGLAVLGDSTLRSLYVAYDLGYLEVGIAPAVVDTDKSDIRSASDLKRARFVGSATQTHTLMSTVPGTDQYLEADAAAMEAFTDMYTVLVGGDYGTASGVASQTAWDDSGVSYYGAYTTASATVAALVNGGSTLALPTAACLLILSILVGAV